MAVVLAATGTAADNFTNQTTLNVPYPAGISADDFLLMYVSAGSTITAPGGVWLAFGSAAVFTTTNAQLMVVYTLATGSESGSVAITTASTTSHGRMFRYTGVDTTTPLDVASTNVSINAQPINITGITTVTNGAMVCAFGGHANRTTTYTQTAGAPTMTEQDDCVQASGANAGRSACHYSDVLATAGATGTVTLNGSASARGLGVLGALRPAGTASALPPILVMPPRTY